MEMRVKMSWDQVYAVIYERIYSEYNSLVLKWEG